MSKNGAGVTLCDRQRNFLAQSGALKPAIDGLCHKMAQLSQEGQERGVRTPKVSMAMADFGF